MVTYQFALPEMYQFLNDLMHVMPCFSQIMFEHAFVHMDQIKAVQSLANWTTWQSECIW